MQDFLRLLMPTSLFAVITTIQEPTPCVRNFAAVLLADHAPLLIIGDSKGPFEYNLDGAELWTLEQQRSLPGQFASLLPVKHYSRKNIGYMLAVERGADCIYETDDDNSPLPNWIARNVEVDAIDVEQQPWTNVYRWFSDELIWPRGFPLEFIRDENTTPHPTHAGNLKSANAPIQQGLANNSPDVDAVWRLVFDRALNFRQAPSILLPPGSWCPFNSQSTWWWPEVYPLLYLPSFCSFRMTDIWRSFVAQRCLWELGKGIVFHGPEVYQERNVHSLYKDFEAEVSGYLRNADLAQRLDTVRLAPGVENVGDNLIRCYEALVEGGAIPSAEIPLVKAWHADIQTLAAARPRP